jgi:hypothetical protein
MAANLARVVLDDADRPEALGQIGLEVLRAGDATEAAKIAQQARALVGEPAAPKEPGPKEAGPKTPAAVPAPSLQALFLALSPNGQLAANQVIVPEPKANAGDPSPGSRQGFAEGLALAGKADAAQTTALAPGNAEYRFRAAVAVAGVLADQGADASQILQAAAALATADMRNRRDVSLPAMRLAVLLTKAGNDQLAQAVTDSIGDEAAAHWARLEVLRARLVARAGQPGDDAWLKPFDDPKKPAIVGALAREALARHNAAVGDSGYKSTVEGWPKGTGLPFGLAGVALGIQDRNQQ